jgi:Uma2 family endonuclease
LADSSLKKDLDVKAGVYATAKILEYWVINLQTRQLIVMRDSVEGLYQSQLTLNDGSISPLALPDLQVAVSRLLD